MTNRFNGWTNYETWSLKLWLAEELKAETAEGAPPIDNEQGLYEHWRDAAREAFDRTDTSGSSDSRKRNAALELAEELKAETAEGAPPADGFYADVLNASIAEVNYREIATALLDDLDD
jgi:hypothetical protein